MSNGVNLFKIYETDKQKEANGVEIDVAGVTFICRRAGGTNRKYRAAVTAAGLARGGATLDPIKDGEKLLEIEDAAQIEAFAKAVVLDWKNVLDRNDQPMLFTEENFVDLMTSCPDVWNALRLEARGNDHFRAEEVEKIAEAAGN